MKILGIETSCDETAAAVVEDGVRVHSNVIFSQVPLHRITGGVVPEVAAREHVLKIMPVIEEALREAGALPGQTQNNTNPEAWQTSMTGIIRHRNALFKPLKGRKSLDVHTNLQSNFKKSNGWISDIDAIAVTAGPGLLSSLVIGTTAASTLAAVWNKPLIGVNHIAGHIYANWLNPVGATDAEDGWRGVNHVKFPCVVLTASGGHNELILMREHAQFTMLGETLDDAAGEAFDKVARMLGMGYPGGPEIALAAQQGDANKYTFPRAHMGADSFDFSFSGLKTAMLQFISREQKSSGKLSPEFIADCSASFQEAVCDVLSDKLLRAAMVHDAQTVIISGGVSANLRLREMIAEKIRDSYFHDHRGRKIALQSWPIFDFPSDKTFCTDNAAMIAGAAYFQVQKAGGLKKFARTGVVLGDPGLRLC